MTNKRTTITRRWKKLLAVGCSHGIYADPDALNVVCAWKDKYKPDTTIHLGDFMDTTCLRGGARGTSDEGVDLGKDFDMGVVFLNRLRPTIVFNGNHEERFYRLLNVASADRRDHGARCVEDLRRTMRQLGATYIEECSLRPAAWVRLGDCLFGHGVLYSQNAIRDHAEVMGSNICMAHVHRPGMEKARMRGGFTGWCVGMLADVDKLRYAHGRRATYAWNQGFVWGEYCDTETVLHVCERTPSGEWRLP